MEQKKITRKQFIALAATVVGVTLLKKLPLGLGEKIKPTDESGDKRIYGNNSYGGNSQA